MEILVVVDMQKDFVTGPLGTPQAREIVPKVVRKIQAHYTDSDMVVFTRDTHYEDYAITQEGKNLPIPHCIYGTEGWEIVPAIKPYTYANYCVDKSTFGSIELAQIIKRIYQRYDNVSVELVGVCTDICIVSNALLLKAAMPELCIEVDASCCAGSTVPKHVAALSILESCQINVKR